MPTGPKGERRKADVIGDALKVTKISTGEEPEDIGPTNGRDPAAEALGNKGGAARAAKVTPERRAEIAKEAAQKRWRTPFGIIPGIFFLIFVVDSEMGLAPQRPTHAAPEHGRYARSAW